MDFFEVLKQKAYNKFKGIFDDRASPPYSDGYLFGVVATIEVLKEMRVGEPGTSSLKHASYPDGTPNTLVLGDLRKNTSLTGVIAGHHGTNGGEVIVLILKKEANLTKE